MTVKIFLATCIISGCLAQNGQGLIPFMYFIKFPRFDLHHRKEVEWVSTILS